MIFIWTDDGHFCLYVSQMLPVIKRGCRHLMEYIADKAKTGEEVDTKV